MKHSVFSEKAKSGEIVYYSAISGESSNGKWSNRISTIFDRMKFDNLLVGMKLRTFVGTNRVLNDIQSAVLLAVLEVSEITTEKVVRKKGIDIDLQTNKVLEEDKETVVLKGIKVSITKADFDELLQFAKEMSAPTEEPQAEETLE